ncbi:MAG: hypothetical protein LKM34_06755 [Prevotella sp.]|jgi:hypothetical protein|nr:hypothetical protein [Prevotella sp.]
MKQHIFAEKYNDMRIRMILLGLIMATTGCYAQLTLLQECRQKAHDNYPLIKQYDLVERLRDYNIANASVQIYHKFQ